ncbi:hypothetical protein GQ54DRAFT_297683, partial [Martensiomyces pterosporus]
MAITVDADAPTNSISPPVAGGVHTAAADLSSLTPENQPAQQARTRRQGRKRAVICRYIQQGAECKAGDECKFLHVADGGENAAPDSRGRNSRGGRGGRGRKPGNGSDGSGEEGDTRPRGKGKHTRGKGRGGQRGGDSYRKTQIENLLKAPQWTVKRLSSERGESAFAVEMKPSDPDFPFDVPRLYMALVVPASYPAKRTSDPVIEIQVANKRIPTGIKRNIEVGFGKYVRRTVNAAVEAGTPENIPSLEEYVHWLDQNLEQLMQQKPATTIKFTSFAAAKTGAAPETRAPQTAASKAEDDDLVSVSSVSSAATTAIPSSRPPVRRPVPKPLRPESALSSSAAAAAAASGKLKEDPRRSMELQQLERRFRSSYAVIRDDASDGTVIKLDIVPSDPDMPADITQITGEITVGRSYPSPAPATADRPQAPAASLKLRADAILGRKGRPSTWQPAEGRSAYLEFIATCFNAHVAEVPGTSLLHHLNWLDRQLFDLLSTPPPPSALESAATASKDKHSQEPAQTGPATSASNQTTSQSRLFGDDSGDRPWVKTITLEEAGLPAGVAGLGLGPLAGVQNLSADSSNSSDSDSESGSDSQAANADEDTSAGEFSKPVRRGTEIRFGKTEFSNVSLAHCHSLNLTVRCARCKNTVELRGIAPTVRTGRDQQMWRACDTCTTMLGVRFRPDWMFQGSTTLGYLDCSGCAPVDLLPSKYTISCESCAMGDKEVEGDASEDDEHSKKPTDTIASVGIGSTTLLNCKTCYARMNVGLHEPQFVQLASGLSLGGGTSSAQISKEVERTRRARVSKREELARLGVVSGQPLPDHGACKHYGKSNRWLRFPCCGKAYPCDTCHDEKEDHSHEYAQVMLCGHCAKEQRISRA